MAKLDRIHHTSFPPVHSTQQLRNKLSDIKIKLAFKVVIATVYQQTNINYDQIKSSLLKWSNPKEIRNKLPDMNKGLWASF